MPVVDGKIVMKAPDGRLFRVAPDEADAATRDLSWQPAGEDETSARVAERERYAKFGSTGQQALGAAEQAVRTATFGQVPGFGGPRKEIAGREAVLREHSPVVSAVAQGVGAIAPALATGGALGGIAGAAGLGARGVGIASALGEGLAGGLAEEVEQARYETRDVSAGNVLLFGLGGEIVGRALPKGIAMGAGRIRRAISPLEELTGEGVSSAVAAAEKRSVSSQARMAREMPQGPERAEALRQTAPQQYDAMAPEMAEDLDTITEMASRMGDTSGSKQVTQRLKDTMADESPAQQDFFTGTKARLSEAKKRLRGAQTPEAPAAAPQVIPKTPGGVEISLIGKDLKEISKLGDDALKQDTLDWLRKDERFLKTGKRFNPQISDAQVASGEGLGFGEGIIVRKNPGGRAFSKVKGDWYLQDGRHAVMVGRERGMTEVFGRVLDEGNEVVYEGMIPIAAKKLDAPIPGPVGSALADTPGLAGFAKRFDQIVDTGMRRLDKTADMAESYLIARDIKKQLQHVSKKMSLTKSPQDAILHEEMRDVIDETWRDIQQGLKDKSLFGDAAEIEADINASWHDKIMKGIGISEQDLSRRVDVDFKTGRTRVEYDPAKARSFLQQDGIARTIAQRRLEMVLEGAEDMAAAHGRHGTWDKAEIEALRGRVERVRQKLSLADEIQYAKADAPDVPKAAPRGSSIGEEAAEYAVEKIIGSAIPFAGQFMRFGKRLLGLDSAGRAATRQTARKLAGTGMGHAQRAIGKLGDYGALPAMTALARFTGDYSGPEESFEAKKRILADEQVSPDVLYEVLAHTLDDLPKVSPELFQRIAGRVAQKIRYLRENLPAGIANTLVYPNGTPPSRSALREWATQWNTVMDPSTVLEDIEAGTATQFQMKTLRESDRDIYDQLRTDVIEEVGINFRHVPITTKLQLDLLFQADGLAGPMFSSAAARMIGDAMKKEQDQPQSGSRPEPETGELAALGGPSGLSAIQSSVTNRGAA